MSIYYRMDRINDNLNNGESKKAGLFPRIVTKKTIFMEELLERTVKRTTLSKAEARIAIEMFWDQIFEELRDGNNVCVDNIGMFSLSATSRRVQDESEIRGNSIEVSRLLFRMSKSCLRKIGPVTFIRQPKDFIKGKKRK